jgi:hypothetical protein
MNYPRKKSKESLVTDYCRADGLNELDQLEGLWCAVAAVHLA